MALCFAARFILVLGGIAGGRNNLFNEMEPCLQARVAHRTTSPALLISPPPGCLLLRRVLPWAGGR